MEYIKLSIYKALKEDAYDQEDAEYYDAYSRCADEVLKREGEGVNYVGALVSYIHRYESEYESEPCNYEAVKGSLDVLADALYSSTGLHQLFEQFIVARKLLDEREPGKTMSTDSAARVIFLCHCASMRL